MKYLIIIPAYNEEKNIYRVVRSIKDYSEKFDIVVINDGSNDDTYQEAKRAGAKVLNLSYNLGIGGAVQTGFLYAYLHNYDAAVQIDGDGQHEIRDLYRLLQGLQKNEGDIIIGSRFVDKTDYNPGVMRRLGIRYFSWIVSLFCRRTYYDPTSGYRLVNRKGIELFKNYYPHDYPEVETIVFAIRNSLTVKEIKVNMQKRKGGCSSITPLRSLYYLVKVTLALIFQPIVKEVLQ
jgi:glycosyltransferase involved in cell wall biosynthesis